MVGTDANVKRSIRADGSVELAAGNCRFVYRRLQPGALLVSIEGDDRGQFGAAALDEVAGEIARFKKPLLLFFDLRRASGPATAVMESWTAWFAAHKDQLRRVTALVPPESRVLHLTVSIAQHLSRTGSLLRICGEKSEFERAIADEVRGFTTLEE